MKSQSRRLPPPPFPGGHRLKPAREPARKTPGPWRDGAAPGGDFFRCGRLHIVNIFLGRREGSSGCAAAIFRERLTRQQNFLFGGRARRTGALGTAIFVAALVISAAVAPLMAVEAAAILAALLVSAIFIAVFIAALITVALRGSVLGWRKIASAGSALSLNDTAST